MVEQQDQLSKPDAASGGTKYTVGSKTVHKFTGTGPFSTPSTFNKTCDYTIIGGGGGSNYDGGGGGGAGGWREGTEPVGALFKISPLRLVVEDRRY